MAFTEKQLAQAEVPNTATSIYGGPASGTAVIRQIIVANHESTAGTFSMWHDDDGTTYNDTTVLAEDIPIGANSILPMGIFIPIDTAGNFAVKADAANKMTITLYGAEVG